MNSSRSFLKRLMIVYMILLVGVALTNYIIDPYFCYRESSMEKYFSWDQRYSPVWRYGITKQFRGYNALWVGSSVSAYVDAEYLNGIMDINCCTGILAGGRPNLYEKYIRNVIENNELDYIFYEFNVPHWTFTSIGTECDLDTWLPKYIQTKTLLDDGEYLLNRTVTEQSAYIIAGGLWDKVIKPGSYISDIDSIMPLDDYYSTRIMAPRIYSNIYYYGPISHDIIMKDYLNAGMDNIDKYVAPLIEENPDTEFIFVAPPTGAVLPATIYESGYLEEWLDVSEAIYRRLLSYPNVRIILSNLDFDYNTNCNHYLDDGHYEPSGAIMMMDCVASGTYEVTLNNMEEIRDAYVHVARDFEWPFLKINFEGDQVLELQRQLVLLGFSVEATGVFDTATENAIKQIQEENGFEVTGIVFSDTADYINNKCGK